MESGTSSLAAVENHRCPSKSGCSYVGLFLEDQRLTRARKPFGAAIKAKAARSACVNKSLRQALESSLVVLLLMSPHLTVLPTLVLSLVEI